LLASRSFSTARAASFSSITRARTWASFRSCSASRLAHFKSKHPGPSRRATPKTPVVHEAKRKSIRAALVAGVKPAQVAKHFGVPLTVVGEVVS
jgi:hypothetical protein